MSIGNTAGYGEEGSGGESSGLGDLAGWLAIASVGISTVGAYYGAISRQYALKSQASSLGFASDMSRLNARTEEFRAQDILRSGALEKGRVTMASGRYRDAIALRQASSGTTIGSGSNAEVMASVEILRQIESIAVDGNTIRQAMAARSRAQDFRTQAALQNVVRLNLLDSAKSVDPYLAAGSTLLGGASQLLAGWQQQGSSSGYRETGEMVPR